MNRFADAALQLESFGAVPVVRVREADRLQVHAMPHARVAAARAKQRDRRAICSSPSPAAIVEDQEDL